MYQGLLIDEEHHMFPIFFFSLVNLSETVALQIKDGTVKKYFLHKVFIIYTFIPAL